MVAAMARSSAGAALTAQHRQAQLRIRAAALRDYMRLWPLWTGDESSFEQLVSVTTPLVRAHHGLSSSIASAYFEAFRRAEGVPGTALARVADPVKADRLATSLYVTGRVMTGKALAAGQTPEAAMQTALVRTSGAVGRYVLDGGRETIIRSTSTDKRARGWGRITGGNACAFCSMLANRGAVYSDVTADFQAHDHCACSAESFYG